MKNMWHDRQQKCTHRIFLSWVAQGKSLKLPGKLRESSFSKMWSPWAHVKVSSGYTCIHTLFSFSQTHHQIAPIFFKHHKTIWLHWIIFIKVCSFRFQSGENMLCLTSNTQTLEAFQHVKFFCSGMFCSETQVMKR